ncbi:MAG: hypothetical protein KKF80_05110, partial [Candidatus Omnitrophica bacterium]|nr:hypothetical protein [Candidatus Omnitrophota bacterium]
LYPLNTPEIKKMVSAVKRCGAKQIITSTYKAKPDNFKRMCRAFPEHAELWKAFYRKEGERNAGYIYLPRPIREKIINEVRKAAQAESLLFSSCREGLTELNTAFCDGSSLFNPDFALGVDEDS